MSEDDDDLYSLSDGEPIEDVWSYTCPVTPVVGNVPKWAWELEEKP